MARVVSWRTRSKPAMTLVPSRRSCSPTKEIADKLSLPDLLQTNMRAGAHSRAIRFSHQLSCNRTTCLGLCRDTETRPAMVRGNTWPAER